MPLSRRRAAWPLRCAIATLGLGAGLALFFGIAALLAAAEPRTSARDAARWDALAGAPAFAGEGERTAQSVLSLFWGGLTVEQKLELLESAKQVRSTALLGFLLEVSWHWLPIEEDFDVARSMLDALYASSGNYLEVSALVCQHVADLTKNPRVRAHAQRYVAALLERRLRLGR